MPTNISAFHLKELRGFRAPLSALAKIAEKVDGSIAITGTTDGQLKVRAESWCEHTTITGVLTHKVTATKTTSDGDVEVDLEFWVEFDDFGYVYQFSGGLDGLIHELLYPVSKGYMKALVVWEDGDSIEMLYVEDGKASSRSLADH